MPEWNIYKNDYKIGQAKTWHKALGILIDLDNIGTYSVIMTCGHISVHTHERPTARYRIIKER